MAAKKKSDLKFKTGEAQTEITGPTGKMIHVQIHEKSRAAEPGCRDRITFEIQYKPANKKKWIKLAFLHGRDSYEDEWRYVLEEDEVKEQALTDALALLGTKTKAEDLIGKIGEKAEKLDQGEIIEILVKRWPDRYQT